MATSNDHEPCRATHQESQATYKNYNTLRKDLREIRLLAIKPCRNAEIIKCTLKQIPLSEANPFYALSYVWGDSEDPGILEIDGQLLFTRRNLYRFLHSLSGLIQSPIMVWVDFICINQTDIEERNSQVAMMGEIYAAADSVYAWLGDATHESDLVFNFVEHIKQRRHRGTAHNRLYGENIAAVEAVADIIDRAYWSRLWIIQEIVLAKRLWLYCGSKVMSWDEMQFAITGYSTKNARSRQNSIFDRRRILEDLKESRDTPTKRPLSELVHKFMTAGCQDRRDKIYGLLSLAHPESVRHVAVDYAKPLLQVLLDTYPDWASEWVQDQDNRDMHIYHTPCYTPSLFCRELSLLLPDDHLISLRGDSSLRESMNATVTLRGTLQGGPFSIRPIATLTSVSEQIIPITEAQNFPLTPQDPNFIGQMISPDSVRDFVYLTTTPSLGDEILNIGPLVLVIRKSLDQRLVVGRGIKVHCSNFENIIDPHIWCSSLLPDSTFSFTDAGRDPLTRNRPPRSLVQIDRNFLGYGNRSYIRNAPADRCCGILRTGSEDGMVSSLSTRSPTCVTLNAAALVELLCAQRLHIFGKSTWSPFEFGLKHGIVDLCRNCSLAINSRKPGLDLGVCNCIWAGGGQLISEYLRKVRKYRA